MCCKTMLIRLNKAFRNLTPFLSFITAFFGNDFTNPATEFCSTFEFPPNTVI